MHRGELWTQLLLTPDCCILLRLRQEIILHTVQCRDVQHQLHIAITSVNLCSQTRAAMSMHSMCMMYTPMLEQLVPVPTAVLTRRHTYTLH
jgi:hypothetical protein